MPAAPTLLMICPPVATPAALADPAFSTMASPVPPAVTALARVRLAAAPVVSMLALLVTVTPATPTVPTVKAVAWA